MNSQVRFLWLPLLVLLLTPVAVIKAEPVKTAHVEAELISEVSSIKAGTPFWVAVRLKMIEHWHTYWQNPGDSGLATRLEWQLPAGFKAAPLQWPYPQKIEAAGLVTFGYEGEILLLSEITPPATLGDATPVTLAVAANWLVCKEECLPESADLKLKLAFGDGQPDSKNARLFATARARLPLDSKLWQMSAATINNVIMLRVLPPAGFNGDLSGLYFFPAQSALIDYATPQAVKKSGESITIELKRSEFAQALPERLEGVLYAPVSLAGERRAIKVSVALAQEVPAAAAPTAAATNSLPGVSSIWLALLFSFVGGLILNLMPCVLPVLSIKVLDFVKQAGSDKGKVWQHGLVFTAGVLVSFWILAGALIALRAGGEQLGWGFQLQSPKFLVALAILFFLFGLNLFGVFEVGTSLMGVGSQASNKSGWLGSFWSGALATIVATPCTAPFMGSALGFALTQPVWASMLIFTFLGLGMSAPYLALSLAPALLKYLPRPGDWMVAFKQFMGFLLMGTVVWLVWVLGQQAGINSVAGLLGALVLSGMGAWVWGRWGNIMQVARIRHAAHFVVIALISVGLIVSLRLAAEGQPNAVAPRDGINWQPFSPQKVSELRAAGKPVFIDFTAAWCLSCQVNERVTFTSAEVRQQFEKLGIVPLKADWTSRDETITRALAEYGRSGVPLYVLYGAKPDQAPIILPEVITPSIVLGELKKIE